MPTVPASSRRASRAAPAETIPVAESACGCAGCGCGHHHSHFAVVLSVIALILAIVAILIACWSNGGDHHHPRFMEGYGMQYSYGYGGNSGGYVNPGGPVQLIPNATTTGGAGSASGSASSGGGGGTSVAPSRSPGLFGGSQTRTSTANGSVSPGN